MTFVVPNAFASPEDFATWNGQAGPANITSVLRSCTALVQKATAMDLYAVDPSTGLPTDTATLGALRDATCIQAAAWVALNIDPASGGVIVSSKAVKSKKLATGAIEYNDAEVQAVAQAREAAYTGLVPDAVQFLRSRGLASFAPRAAWGPRLHPGWYWQ